MLGESVSLRLSVAPLFDEENPNEKRLMAIVSFHLYAFYIFVKVLSLYDVVVCFFKVGISTDKTVYLKRSYAKGKKKRKERKKEK